MASRQRANGFDTNFAKCDPHHRLFSERIVWSLFDLKVTRKPAFTEAWLPLASLEVTRCLLFLKFPFRTVRRILQFTPLLFALLFQGALQFAVAEGGSDSPDATARPVTINFE